MQNYFNYFTEIEERFQQRRGSLLLLSTLDWALIESWREAGVPLEAITRGIDNAFDKHDARAARSKRSLRKVNSLAWCVQEVMAVVEQMKEAAVGTEPAVKTAVESGFEPAPVAAFLQKNAALLAEAKLQPPADSVAATTAQRLRELAAAVLDNSAPPLEELERNLLVLEEKLLAALTASAAEEELLALRTQAARELAPYRSRITGVQARQIEQQFLHKRLLEARKLPRLSLFYMGHT